MSEANKVKQWNSDRTNFDRNLAVVIGIDNYENHPKIHNLSTPVKDAKAFAELLKKHYGYKEEDILCLFNDDADLKGLRDLLTNVLPNQIKPTQNDRLIFYFAGHGLPKDSDKGPKGYLVPQDAQWDEGDSLLPMDEVYEVLCKNLQCHHLLIILDCCFAGTFRWASSRKLIAELEKIRREHYDRFIRHAACQLITSSAHDQEALDSAKLAQDQREQVKDTDHSPFALALLEALGDSKQHDDGKQYQNADYTKDGVITAHELIVYLGDRVSQLTQKHQAPGLYPLKHEYDKGEFIFVKPDFNRDNLSPAPELNEENNPYRGLKPFEERHADLFFGRQKLIEELGDRLAKSHCPLTVVLGTSGSGKSSLVKAGLIPHLRKKREKESTQHWCILTPIRPGTSPFTELAKAVLPIVNDDLVDRLKKMKFLDEIIEKVLNPESEQKSTKPNSDESHSQESEKADEAIQLARQWNRASSEAKLMLFVDYFNVLKEFFKAQPGQRIQLSQLYEGINSTLKPLTDKLQQEPESFKDAISKWKEKHPKTKVLLVIDQFEELITMRQEGREEREKDSKEWQEFLSLLRMALVKYRQELRVVVTLRSDFEPRFLDSTLKKYWEKARFPVKAMNTHELREAIEGPALKQALYFEPSELVGQLIEEVWQMPGALPLLSFTLSELYIKLYQRWTKDQSTERALRIEDYTALGRVAGALTRRATDEHSALNKKQRATLERIMLRMVAMDGAGVARRRVLESELEYPSNEENDRVQKLIDKFVNLRLLVKGQQNGAPYVEPAHDLLVRGWGLLQEWITKGQESLVLQQPLAEDAREWEKHNKPEDNPDLLWTDDSRVEQLEKIIAKPESSWLNKVETEFIKACGRWRDRQARDRLEKEIELYTELSQRLFTGNDRLDAVVKMIEAGKLLQKGLKITEYKEFEFLITFNQLLSECSEVNSIEIGDQVNTFSFNQACQAIATVSGYYDKICLWDWQGNLINCEQNEERFLDLAFSPDGKILVTSGNEGLIKFYRKELNDWHIFHETQGDIKKHDGTVHCVDFSPDGKFLISVGFDRKIIFWGREGQYFTTIVHEHNVAAVAFSPKNQRIAFVSRHKQTDKDILVVKEYYIFDDKILQADSSDYIKLDDFDEFDVHQVGGITDISFSPDGTTLASVDKDGGLCIWSLDKSKNSREIREKKDGNIRAVAFSPDGKIVASSHTNGVINIWDALNTDIYGNVPHLYKLMGHKHSINRINFTFNGSQLLSGSDDGTVKFWSLADRFEGYTTSDIQKICFSKDNQIISTVDTDGKLLFWGSGGEPLKILIDNEISVSSELCDVQISDESIVVAKAENEELEIKLYSSNGILESGFVISHEQAINSLIFSPRNDVLISISNGSISLWLVNKDRNTLTVKLWTTLVGQYGDITAITFSDDGKFLASASVDGAVKLWHLKDSQSIFSLPVDENAIYNLVEYSVYQPIDPDVKIYALLFYCEDRILAAINQLGYLTLWNIDGSIQNNIKLLEKLALYKHVEAATFSANGHEIAMVTCKDDSFYSERRIQTYNLNLAKLIEIAGSRIRNYARYKSINL